MVEQPRASTGGRCETPDADARIVPALERFIDRSESPSCYVLAAQAITTRSEHAGFATPRRAHRSIPASEGWPASHLFNHLMVQPTVFYAVAISLALLERGEGWPLWLAWSYVGIRVVHSVVQATWNKIEVRFSLFALSSLALIGMTIGALRVTL